MTGNVVTIKLTAEQQKQIKDATGKKVTELHMELVPASGLSDKDLDNVSGGIAIQNFKFSE